MMGEGHRPDRADAFIGALRRAWGMGPPVPRAHKGLLQRLALELSERDLVRLRCADKEGWPPGLAAFVEDFAADALARKRQR